VFLLSQIWVLCAVFSRLFSFGTLVAARGGTRWPTIAGIWYVVSQRAMPPVIRATRFLGNLCTSPRRRMSSRPPPWEKEGRGMPARRSIARREPQRCPASVTVASRKQQRFPPPARTAIRNWLQQVPGFARQPFGRRCKLNLENDSRASPDISLNGNGAMRRTALFPDEIGPNGAGHQGSTLSCCTLSADPFGTPSHDEREHGFLGAIPEVGQRAPATSDPEAIPDSSVPTLKKKRARRPNAGPAIFYASEEYFARKTTLWRTTSSFRWQNPNETRRRPGRLPVGKRPWVDAR